MVAISIGKMRQRVSIYSVSGVADAIGGQTSTRVLEKVVWAEVTSTSGQRVFQEQSIKTNNEYTVTMRTGSYPLSTKNILEWEGIEMTINSLITDEVKRYTIATVWART